MSQLEEAAKSLLTPLSKGDARNFSPAEQVTIARWFTLKMMVAEHDIHGVSVFSPLANQSFYAYRIIPMGLQIWLLRCGCWPWTSAYMRIACEAKLAQSPITPEQIAEALGALDGPPNTQSVSLGFNELFIHANFTVHANLKLNLKDCERFGVRIWPPLPSDIHWPPPLGLSLSAANSIASSLNRVPRVVGGSGPPIVNL
jgi:hypothetical protein